jgi:hypothetical protein
MLRYVAVLITAVTMASCSLVDFNAPKGTGDAISKVGDGINTTGEGLKRIGDSINNANLSPFPPSPNTVFTEKPIKTKNPDGTFTVSGEFIENSVKNHKWRERVEAWKEKNLIK